VALGQFQELERVCALHLCLQVIGHELDFFELASELESVGLQDAGLLLYHLIEIFQSVLNDLCNRVLGSLGLVLDGSNFARDLVHLISDHLLSLFQSSIWVPCPFLGS